MSLLSYAKHVVELTESDHPSHQFVFDRLFLDPSRQSQISESSDRLINSDLDYICRVWKDGGYEPWEEVNAGYPDSSSDEVGGHFYVLMVQRQALLFGANFATSIGDNACAKRWNESASDIASALEAFWNPTGELEKEGSGTDGPLKESDWNDPRRHLLSIPQELLHRPHIVPTLHRRNGQQKPIQADVQTLLGFTHGGDGTWFAAKEDGPWVSWSDRALASLDRLVEVFKIVYELNTGRDTTKDGVLCGRYPVSSDRPRNVPSANLSFFRTTQEDIYDGKQTSVGHPWFICTHAIVEVLSLSANHFTEVGTFTPTAHSLRLFKRFHANLQAGKTYKKGQDGEFEPVLRGMRSMAKAYLDNARTYAGPEGRMDEQIDRVDEMMRGARELTWSFASFLSARDAMQDEGLDT
jgi:glucoamylase